MRISDWSSDVCSSDLIAGAAEAGIFEMVVFEVADRVRHIRLTRDEGLFPDRLAVAHDAAGAFDMIGERAGQQFGAERGRAQLGMREPKIIAAFGDVIGKFVGEREAEPYRRAEIGRAHVWTPVTNAHLVCSLLLEKKKKKN